MLLAVSEMAGAIVALMLHHVLSQQTKGDIRERNHHRSNAQRSVLMLLARRKGIAPLFAKSVRRNVVPTLKGTMKSTRFREAQQESNFGY